MRILKSKKQPSHVLTEAALTFRIDVTVELRKADDARFSLEDALSKLVVYQGGRADWLQIGLERDSAGSWRANARIPLWVQFGSAAMGLQSS
jgi:hypothetical protein